MGKDERVSKKKLVLQEPFTTDRIAAKRPSQSIVIVARSMAFRLNSRSLLPIVVSVFGTVRFEFADSVDSSNLSTIEII